MAIMATASPHRDRPTPLHREASQQELEIAQHLLDHAQSVRNQQQVPQSMRYPSDIPGYRPVQAPADETRNASPEHHDLSDIPQQYAQTYSTPSATVQHAAVPPAPRRTPSTSGTVPGGQMCSNCGTTKTPLWRRSPQGAVICNACGLYYKARNQMRPVGLKRGGASTQQPDGPRRDRSVSPTSIQAHATYVTADQSVNGTCPGGGRCNGTGGLQCCNGCPAYNNRISKTAQVALQHSATGPDDANASQPFSQTPTGNVVVACQNCGTTITPLWRRDEAGNTICNACGLYHKLHGSHRPVQMKKAEIKRRKRVVPTDSSQYEQTSPGMSESIDDDTPTLHSDPRASMPLSAISAAYEQPRTAGGPIPVDFTDAFRNHSLHHRQEHREEHHHRHHHEHEHEHHHHANESRKRSFSTTTHGRVDHDQDHQRGDEHTQLRSHENGPYPHAQNVISLRQDENIDPSLAAEIRSSAAPPSSTVKDARRAELQRQAETMRQMLLEKERELAELGEG